MLDVLWVSRFVLLAADASAARSILVFKTDQDKILALDNHKLLATAVGDEIIHTGDRWHEIPYIHS